MIPHPSLFATFKPPKLLAPVRKVDNPYDPCWCGSGKKWKWCHKDREKQTLAPLGAHAYEMRTELAKGAYCLHPEASPETCEERIIRAHTIQRKGGLAKITEEGHVISIKAGFEDLFKNEGEVIPRLLSARDASTFTGFCGQHDNKMFKPVETGRPILNKENVFLFSFRALAYELYMKEAALRCVPVQRESDKGKPFEIQCFIQQWLTDYEYGLNLGLADARRWKSQYDTAFLNKQFDCLRFYSVAFSEVLPVMACGAFHPEFDFDGTPLQVLGRGEAPFEHLTYNLTALDGASVLVFGWTEEYDGPATQFVRSYQKLTSSDKADAAVRLAFEHVENVYMKPSWWNGLDRTIQQEAIKRARTGIGVFGNDRQPECLRDGIVRYVRAEIIEEVSSLEP